MGLDTPCGQADNEVSGASSLGTDSGARRVLVPRAHPPISDKEMK